MLGSRDPFPVSGDREQLVNDSSQTSFFDFPKDMVQLIGSKIPNNADKAKFALLNRQTNNFFQDDLNKQKLLHYIANGKKEAVKKMLDKNPRLVLQAANTMTPGGLSLIGVTPYECALACGDPDMALMIGEYFEKFEGGIEERAAQFKRYEKSIDNMLNVEPYDFTKLINIIKQNSADDVTAELATGKNYDPSYKSALRTELEKFRIAFAPRELKTPNDQIEYIGFIYASLLQILRLLDKEWNTLSNHGSNYDKCDLVWRQLFGFPGRRLPIVERFAFAQGLDNINGGVTFARSLTNIDNSHSGVGFEFDFAVSIYGRFGDGVAYLLGVLEKLFRAKAAGFEKVRQQLQPSPELHEVSRVRRSGCVIV